jgi:hypothetical protein
VRVFIPAALFGLLVSLSGCSSLADDANADRTPDMQKVAQAFVKAYQAKDLDALMQTVDAPFLVGTVRDPRTFKTEAQLRADLKSRLSSGKKFPTEVAKALTWGKAIPAEAGADDQKRQRAAMKPAIDVTGENGGYAALGDKVRGGLAISGTRLLVGIRGGKAKVVGILED